MRIERAPGGPLTAEMVEILLAAMADRAEHLRVTGRRTAAYPHTFGDIAKRAGVSIPTVKAWLRGPKPAG